MVTMNQALGAINTAALGGVAISLLKIQAQMDLLVADQPGGAGRPTHVSAGAAAGGDGSEARPFATLDEAVAKINESAAAQAVATGTSAELAATMTPARVYLAPGTYTQSKPFLAPAIVIPAPGSVVSSALQWSPPAHNSASTGVPWTGGLLVEEFYGSDPNVMPDLVFITATPTLGSWAHALVLSGSVAGVNAAPDASVAGDIAISGGQSVQLIIDDYVVDAITQDVGNLFATRSLITSVAITTGSATIDDTTVAGALAATNVFMKNGSVASSGVTGVLDVRDSKVAGAIVGNTTAFGADLRTVTALTGTLTTDTAGYAALKAASVTPSSTVTLYGTTGGDVAASGSPQTIAFGVTFPAVPSGVTVTPEATTIDATTFAGITSVTATGVVVAYGGAGAGAPTRFHWVATL